MTDLQALGNRLIELRKKAKLTALEVESRTGILVQLLVKLEDGSRAPSTTDINILARLYGGDYIKLMTLAGYLRPRKEGN